MTFTTKVATKVKVNDAITISRGTLKVKKVRVLCDKTTVVYGTYEYFGRTFSTTRRFASGRKVEVVS